MKFTNILILTALVPVIVLQGQGCTGDYINTESGNSASSGYLTDDGVVGAKAVESYRMVSIAEIRPSLESVLGLPLSSGSVGRANAWNVLYSTSGDPESITAPMWIGIMSISGEGCMDLINKEKNLTADTRTFFKDVDFKRGPASQKTTFIDNSIRNLARAAWARNETNEELQIFKSELQVFTGDMVADTSKMALIMCAGTLSALEMNIR